MNEYTTNQPNQPTQWLSAGGRVRKAGTDRRPPAVYLPSHEGERNWRGAACRLRVVRSPSEGGKLRLVSRIERKKSA